MFEKPMEYELVFEHSLKCRIMEIIRDIFAGKCGNHIHPFTGLSARETEEDIENKVRRLHDAGILSMDLLWENPDKTADYAPFNDEVYWTRINWIVKYCRKYGMTFMIQDAAPFPTGRADGWLDRPEYAHLRKLYLAQRHLDVVGPLENGRFRIDLLTGTKSTHSLFQGNASIPLTGDQMIAAVAVKLDADGKICAEPVDLTDCVQDGILFWDVPEGKWRIISAYETYNGGGRVGFMNLLDRESVALQIKAVYESHYAHLKDEIGKTWVGMFYDEPEIGNMECFFFTQRVGTPQDLGGKPMDLPWSKETAQLWAKEEGDRWRKELAYFWYEGVDDVHEPVRYRYLDLISNLVKENYTGQVYAWCKEKGIQYIGHVLEDDNSHCRLACGSVHFFRTQAHQDMGGIDMIGNQMMPGKDYIQAWYGSPEGDGEFYHYGLAKLGSSVGHICPEKKGRSFCEIFAVYGVLAGTRMRKSVMDHLFVNGITELIPNDPVFEHLDMEYSRLQNAYSNRMCHLLTHTKPIIKTAVLYHAENEWYAGECMKFQVPAAELAKHQISYDIIPADVFSQREHYQTDCTNGLCINGNSYDALIIPEAKALPRCVADFLTGEAQQAFPVFFLNSKPVVETQTGSPIGDLHGTCVSIENLATEVRKAIRRDISLENENRGIRYAHYVDGIGDRATHIYMIYNQGADTTVTFSVPYQGRALEADLMNMQTQWLPDGEGVVLKLRSQESKLICFGYLCTEEGIQEAGLSPKPYKPVMKTLSLDGPWTVTMEGLGQTFILKELKDLGTKELYPRYIDKIIYEITLNLTEIPAEMDLGDVHEAAELYVNGKCAGIRLAPGYRFCTDDLFVPGENAIRVEVYPNQASRPIPDNVVEGIIESISAAAYCALEPVGMLGPVELIYK